MKKKALNLYVDSYLIDKAKDHGLVISKFLENQLRGYFNFIKQGQMHYSPSKNINDSNFEASSELCNVSKSNNQSHYYKPSSRVCSLAWIGQGPPEPLARVQIPADPFCSLGENSVNRA